MRKVKLIGKKARFRMAASLPYMRRVCALKELLKNELIYLGNFQAALVGKHCLVISPRVAWKGHGNAMEARNRLCAILGLKFLVLTCAASLFEGYFAMQRTSGSSTAWAFINRGNSVYTVKLS